MITGEIKKTSDAVEILNFRIAAESTGIAESGNDRIFIPCFCRQPIDAE